MSQFISLNYRHNYPKKWMQFLPT